MGYYVTHIKIERVDVINPVGTHPSRIKAEDQRREVTEVGSVTVKAASLAALARKIAGHIELFDDERAIKAPDAVPAGQAINPVDAMRLAGRL